MIEVTKPRAIALGYFDGVHLGHGALLRRVAGISLLTSVQQSIMNFGILMMRLLFFVFGEVITS